MFFNVGGAEILVIAVIALIAVGPEQLPTVIRKFGRTMGQVRSMAAGLRDEFMAGASDITDAVDPSSWLTGTGSDADPVVRRGYADLVNNRNGDAEDPAGDAGPAPITAAGDVEVAGVVEPVPGAGVGDVEVAGVVEPVPGAGVGDVEVAGVAEPVPAAADGAPTAEGEERA